MSKPPQKKVVETTISQTSQHVMSTAIDSQKQGQLLQSSSSTQVVVLNQNGGSSQHNKGNAGEDKHLSTFDARQRAE